MTPSESHIAVAHWSRKTREAKNVRDDMIGRMRDTGATLRQIAEAAQLSPEAIRKILARR